MTIAARLFADEGSPSSRRSGTISYGLMLAWAAFALMPIVFMFVSAFKPVDAVFADLRAPNPFAALLPTSVTLENFRQVFERTPFLNYLFNSTTVATVSVAFSLAVNSMAAFALARLEWRGRRWMLMLVVALLVVPFEAIAIPLLFVVNQLPWVDIGASGVEFQRSWLNTLHVQIIPFVADAFSIFLFYQFFLDIPRDFDEAARIDGASPFQIYWHIILPLSRPVIASVAILQFQARWNDYLWPVIAVPGQARRPLTVGITTFYTQNPEWGQILAYASMITLPVLAIFMIFQRWFIQSVMASGVKS
ncbi:MAG: carbohydrate ABC transporter permease [Rhizobiales bacterium]|nr:carbohydrate ABC transporter permease [Hyphomicrobiales bacterium]